MILRLLDIINGCAIALEIPESRLKAFLKLGAPSSGHTVVSIQGLRLLFSFSVEEGKVD